MPTQISIWAPPKAADSVHGPPAGSGIRPAAGPKPTSSIPDATVGILDTVTELFYYNGGVMMFIIVITIYILLLLLFIILILIIIILYTC